MTNNDQWLFENTPRITYSANSVRRNSGLKMLASHTRYPATPNSEYTGVKVYFGNFFTPGCHPIVTATVSTSSSPHKKYVTLCNIDGNNNEIVDHRGFTGLIHAVPWQGTTFDALRNSGILHWVAVGY